MHPSPSVGHPKRCQKGGLRNRGRRDGGPVSLWESPAPPGVSSPESKISPSSPSMLAIDYSDTVLVHRARITTNRPKKPSHPVGNPSRWSPHPLPSIPCTRRREAELGVQELSYPESISSAFSKDPTVVAIRAALFQARLSSPPLTSALPAD